SIIDFPSKGTLTGTAPNYTYTPTAGQSGTDEFTYQILDSHNHAATGHVTLTLQLNGYTATLANLNDVLPLASATPVTVSVTLDASMAGQTLLLTMPSVTTTSGTTAVKVAAGTNLVIDGTAAPNVTLLPGSRRMFTVDSGATLTLRHV